MQALHINMNPLIFVCHPTFKVVPYVGLVLLLPGSASTNVPEAACKY